MDTKIIVKFNNNVCCSYLTLLVAWQEKILLKLVIITLKSTRGWNMLESAERIQYITDYISNYENKIKMLNKLVLFDNTTLFELFAIECLSLWFGQRFSNKSLNISLR